MSKFRALMLTVVLCVAPLFANNGEISPKTVQKWMEFLAGDEMKGRANGSPELDKAAYWLVRRLKDAGLTTVPGQDSFFHEYTVTDRRGNTYDGKNVLAWLEGSDPKLKHEYIMLSGHYDHVGVNEDAPGDDKIFNGADDDASGVLTSLGIVTMLQRLQEDPNFVGLKRSVLFVAWGAEEVGLLGSGDYIKKPWLPVKDMSANLNFELTGHSAKTGKKKIWTVGADFSELDEVVKPVLESYGWELVKEPFPKYNLFFRSDNIHFAMMERDMEKKTATGVPAHSFSTWGGGEHYHAPNDDPSGIDYQNMADLIEAMTRVVIDLANRDGVIQWTENDKFEFTRPE